MPPDVTPPGQPPAETAPAAPKPAAPKPEAPAPPPSEPVPAATANPTPPSRPAVETSRLHRLLTVGGTILGLFILYEVVTYFVAYTDDAYVRSDLVAVAGRPDLDVL